MKVRAKFTVRSIDRVWTGNHEVTDPETGVKSKKAQECVTITLNPVSSNNDPESENSKFWKYTPSGEIKMSVLNPDAAAVFEIGKPFYVDFTPAPE